MKVTIGGETFDSSWDLQHTSMSDALAIERLAGRRYVEWEQEFLRGSAEALAAFAVFTWQRDGRVAEMKDILEGAVDFDFGEAYKSIMKSITDANADENPTPGAETSSAPDGTDSTPSGTRPSSPRSSTSARGKSGS